MSDSFKNQPPSPFPFQSASSMVNTQLSLVYRCAGREPIRQSVVLIGAITDAQIGIIQRRAIRGHLVVASQAGLPSPADAIDRESLDSTDHALTSLEDWEEGIPSAKDLHTNNRSTLSLPVGALIGQMISLQWDVEYEHKRMGIHSGPVSLTETADHYETPSYQVG